MATLREQLGEKLAPLRAAIAGESPAGADLTYDAAFDRLKSEVEKLGAMSGGTPAWPSIDEIGVEFLTTRSKDFRVAVWWTTARMHTAGLGGLAEGLLALQSLSNDFWETMHPPLKRARARGNLTSWLGEQVEAFLAGVTPSAADREPVELIAELYNELDALWSDKLGEAYGGMGGLRAILRSKVAEVPAAVPAAASAAAPTAQAAASPPAGAPAAPVTEASASGVAAAIPPIASAADVPRALRALGGSIRDMARELRRVDPTAAQAYRLQRVGLWIAVSTLPPAEGGKTRVPAPGSDVQKKLEGLFTSEKWLELLEAAESSMAQYIYWFDLHRYSALALDRLGPTFAAARAALGRELNEFLSQYPPIRGLKFADGTPFTSPATATWLDEELAKTGGDAASGGGGSRALSMEDEELASRLEHARELVNKGEAAEGLALALALANRGPDERTRFRSRLSVSRLAIQSNRLDIAESLLTQLALEIERRALEAWEPELAASVYSSLLFCLNSAKTKDAKRYESLFAKLCQLDPKAAIKLSGS